MKKILSILSTISLSTIISTNIIACKEQNKNKQNNKPNINNEHNKPIKPQFIAQQPPKNSNGKLIEDVGEEVKKTSDEKGYIGIYDKYYYEINKYGIIEKFNNIKKIRFNYGNEVYRGDGNGEPQTPTINKNTGEITDGNEK